jgi:hypothetical protein
LSAAAPPDSISNPPKITRGHSCILCQQRKVRCDRQKPCSNCLKARAECIPSAPTLPRRRRKKLAETDLAGRLKKYEHLLRSHNIKIEDDDDAEPSSVDLPEESTFRPHSLLSLTVPRPRNTERGALFADKGNSHYVERYHC